MARKDIQEARECAVRVRVARVPDMPTPLYPTAGCLQSAPPCHDAADPPEDKRVATPRSSPTPALHRLIAARSVITLIDNRRLYCHGGARHRPISHRCSRVCGVYYCSKDEQQRGRGRVWWWWGVGSRGGGEREGWG